MRYAYLVYVVDTTPHNFSSDWQDHREYKLVCVYLSKAKAEAYKARRSAQGNCSVMIKQEPVSE